MSELLTFNKVAKRYKVTKKTIEHWVDSERFDFPAPVIGPRIGAGHRKYWRENELDAFDARMERLRKVRPKCNEMRWSSKTGVRLTSTP